MFSSRDRGKEKGLLQLEIEGLGVYGRVPELCCQAKAESRRLLTDCIWLLTGCSVPEYATQARIGRDYWLVCHDQRAVGSC